MRIIQLDKSFETIKSLGFDEYNKVYFLTLVESKIKSGTLVESKIKSGTDNYVFRSKRLDYLKLNELESYLNDPEFILVKIEKE